MVLESESPGSLRGRESKLKMDRLVLRLGEKLVHGDRGGHFEFFRRRVGEREADR